MSEALLKRVTWPMVFVAIAVTMVLAILVARKSFAQPQQVGSTNIPIALVGERIYISPLVAPIENGVILIRDGKIAAVGKHAKADVPEGTGELDCRGMYVMAGFQNSHVHFTQPIWNNAAKLPAAQLTQLLEMNLVRYGFTTVVDTGSDLANTEAIRNRINSGEVAGPRILTSGSPLYPPNGFPYYLKNSIPEEIWKQLAQPKTPAEAIRIVDERIADGADIIKLFTGSWVAKGQAVTMPLDVAEAAVAEAHKHGKLVWAHPSNVAGFQIALQAHVDVLAHAVEDLRGWKESYLKRMKDQGMWMIPTLALFSHDSNIADIMEEVDDYADMHGPILFGTDAGFLPSFNPTDEYLILQRAGLTLNQILDSLTTAPAKRLDESATRGQIRVGMEADLVVLGKDPQQDISNLADVTYTFRQGRIVYSVSNQ
ncbi:MAG TPA: amidohydrolase family protein [Candidatus Acidoferrales bacterium]|nr:amidohydrolase family protein [Candidatus Acidoferrales bacterium]